VGVIKLATDMYKFFNVLVELGAITGIYVCLQNLERLKNE